MQSNYMYIICRDGHVIELEGNENKMLGLVTAMKDKGIITLKERGIILNTVDISKILSKNEYFNYIDSVKPKEYLLDGSWYDSKEKRVLRHESWKQEKLDSRKQIEAPDTRTPEEMKQIQEETKRIGEMLKSKYSI